MKVKVNHREIELWAREALRNLDELEKKVARVQKKFARRTPWWRKLSPMYWRLVHFDGIRKDLIAGSRVAYNGYLESIEKMQKVETYMNEKEYSSLQRWRRHANQVVEILAWVTPKKSQGPFR